MGKCYTFQRHLHLKVSPEILYFYNIFEFWILLNIFANFFCYRWQMVSQLLLCWQMLSLLWLKLWQMLLSIECLPLNVWQMLLPCGIWPLMPFVTDVIVTYLWIKIPLEVAIVTDGKSHGFSGRCYYHSGWWNYHYLADVNCHVAVGTPSFWQLGLIF